MEAVTPLLRDSTHVVDIYHHLSWACTPCSCAVVVAVAPLFQGKRSRSNQTASTTLSALVQGRCPPGVLARVGLQMHQRRRTGCQAVAELAGWIVNCSG